MAAKQADYQQMTSELAVIVEKLQADETSIEESLKLYERGIKLTEEINSFLETAENRLKKINTGR